MPVSIVRPLGGTDSNGPTFRDPRFGKQKTFDQQQSKNYQFLKEVQDDRMRELKGLRKKAKKTGNADALLNIREMLGEEK